jgi:hypothetical protein
VTDFTRGFPAAIHWAATVGLSPDQFALRAAILLAAVFPAMTMACHWYLRRRQRVADEQPSFMAVFGRSRKQNAKGQSTTAERIS